MDESEHVDWQGRARREAAAIISGAIANLAVIDDYDLTLMLVAVAWLQGVNVGAHETLTQAEVAFNSLRDSL